MHRRYEHELAGHNWRMTDLQAAVAIPQLDRLADTNATRNVNAAALTDRLCDLPGLVTPIVPSDRTHAFHRYTVRVEPGASITRDELVMRVTRAGVGVGVYYPRVVFDADAYRDDPRVESKPTPGAERCAAEVASLPVHPSLTPGDIGCIADAVSAALADNG
jgi:dTDP-4-amino-4,6-dideoxygalactose transaminase